MPVPPGPPLPQTPPPFITWLLCKRCRLPLAPIFSDGARTYLFVAAQGRAYDMVLTCRCGLERRFVSVKAPAH